MRSSSNIAMRGLGRKKSLALIALCPFLIFGAVVLMNLESPRKITPRMTPATVKLSARRLAERASPAKPTIERVGSNADAVALGVTDLLIPVAGVAADKLRDSFYDSRSEGRVHGAIDIMAPRDTPVLAAADGTVMKLHQSERGGIMLYQSDRTGDYVFYYGHLARYAEGVSEGQQLRRGEVIGYVGDTGNAGAGNFHLHFGVSKMTAAGRWYGGEPINPYPLLAGRPGETIGGK